MVEEQENANEEVVQPQDEDVSSSETELAEPTAEEGAQEEVKQDVPFHEHPRWQELQQERQELREQNQQLLQMIQQQATQRQPITQEQKDELEAKLVNLDPASREWMRDLYKDMHKITQKELQKAGQQFTEVINKQNQVIAELQEKDFRRTHQDIPMNSAEERQVADLIKKGIAPDQAAWAVMGPKRVQQAEQKGQAKKSQSTKAKQQANLETPSIAANAPVEENIPFREALEREAKKSGLW